MCKQWGATVRIWLSDDAVIVISIVTTHSMPTNMQKSKKKNEQEKKGEKSRVCLLLVCVCFFFLFGHLLHVSLRSTTSSSCVLSGWGAMVYLSTTPDNLAPYRIYRETSRSHLTEKFKVKFCLLLVHRNTLIKTRGVQFWISCLRFSSSFSLGRSVYISQFTKYIFFFHMFDVTIESTKICRGIKCIAHSHCTMIHIFQWTLKFDPCLWENFMFVSVHAVSTDWCK